MFCRLTMQIWDLDLFGNEFIGGTQMDLRKMIKPDRSSKECGIKQEEDKEDKEDKYMDLFKTRNAKGWWAVSAQVDDKEKPGEKKRVCKVIAFVPVVLIAKS